MSLKSKFSFKKLYVAMTASLALTLTAMSTTAGAATIGAILPLTGTNATIGDDQRRGIELAVEQVNAKGGVLGAPLVVKVEDSGDTATGGLDAAAKLNNINKVPLVIGEYSSGVTIPVGQYLVKEGLVQINIGSTSPAVRKIGKGSFSVIGLDDLTAKFSAQDVLSLGYQKVALIAPNGAYGQGISDEFKKSFEAAGGKVVSQILYNPGQSSYRRELQQLQRSQPQAFVYTAYGQESAIINREAFELGLRKTPWYAMYMSMCTSDTPPEIADGQIGMEVSWFGEQGKAFQEAYTKKFGFAIKSSFSSYAYDGVMLAAAAINKAGSEDPAKIAEAIAALGKDFNSATGTLDLDASGQRQQQPYDKRAYNKTGIQER